MKENTSKIPDCAFKEIQKELAKISASENKESFFEFMQKSKEIIENNRINNG